MSSLEASSSSRRAEQLLTLAVDCVRFPENESVLEKFFRESGAAASSILAVVAIAACPGQRNRFVDEWGDNESIIRGLCSADLKGVEISTEKFQAIVERHSLDKEIQRIECLCGIRNLKPADDHDSRERNVLDKWKEEKRQRLRRAEDSNAEISLKSTSELVKCVKDSIQSLRILQYALVLESRGENKNLDLAELSDLEEGVITILNQVTSDNQADSEQEEIAKKLLYFSIIDLLFVTESVLLFACNSNNRSNNLSTILRDFHIHEHWPLLQLFLDQPTKFLDSHEAANSMASFFAALYSDKNAKCAVEIEYLIRETLDISCEPRDYVLSFACELIRLYIHQATENETKEIICRVNGLVSWSREILSPLSIDKLSRTLHICLNSKHITELKLWASDVEKFSKTQVLYEALKKPPASIVELLKFGVVDDSKCYHVCTFLSRNSGCIFPSDISISSTILLDFLLNSITEVLLFSTRTESGRLLKNIIPELFSASFASRSLEFLQQEIDKSANLMLSGSMILIFKSVLLTLEHYARSKEVRFRYQWIQVLWTTWLQVLTDQLEGKASEMCFYLFISTLNSSRIASVEEYVVHIPATVIFINRLLERFPMHKELLELKVKMSSSIDISSNISI